MAEGASRDLLAGHMHYRKLQDLNEGTFGVVMLAQDVRTNEEVRYCDF
jgi:serine/threonine-protein kinase SRK2